MDFLVANVDHLTFKIESDLNEQNGALPIAFPGMDSKLFEQSKIFTILISVF